MELSICIFDLEISLIVLSKPMVIKDQSWCISRFAFAVVTLCITDAFGDAPDMAEDAFWYPVEPSDRLGDWYHFLGEAKFLGRAMPVRVYNHEDRVCICFLRNLTGFAISNV